MEKSETEGFSAFLVWVGLIKTGEILVTVHKQYTHRLQKIAVLNCYFYHILNSIYYLTVSILNTFGLTIISKLFNFNSDFNFTNF